VAELGSRILDALARSGRPLDDDDLAARLDVVRQAVNAASYPGKNGSAEGLVPAGRS
jgi:hypothetical protein